MGAKMPIGRRIAVALFLSINRNSLSSPKCRAISSAVPYLLSVFVYALATSAASPRSAGQGCGFRLPAAPPLCCPSASSRTRPQPPRPPPRCRTAPTPVSACPPPDPQSSHYPAPCGARHTVQVPLIDVSDISIHAPLAGRDFDHRHESHVLHIFQSTRPLRGATAKIHKKVMVFLHKLATSNKIHKNRPPVKVVSIT